MAAEAGSIRGQIGGNVSQVLSPLGGLIKWIIVLTISTAVLLLIAFLIWIGFNYYRTGSVDVASARVGVAAEEPIGVFGNALFKISPNLYALWEGNVNYQDSFSAEVETNQQNPNLGVKIFEFKALESSVLEGEPMMFEGRIVANSLADQIEFQAHCSMEEYNKGSLMPAKLSGNPTANGNKGIVFKDQTNAEFTATCIFPGEAVKIEKPREPKKAYLHVTYEFTTKGTQKVYFLDRNEMLALKGEDPFKIYKLSDPQLGMDRKIKSKSTDGPINLAFGIDNPQPFTQDTVYRLNLQLSNNLGWSGSLKKVSDIKLQMPAVKDIELVIDGEGGFSGSSDVRCDFEYIGQGDEGFKLYKVSDASLNNVNKDCSEKNLRTIALSRSECISLFKERPTFSCFVKPLRVPKLLPQYDVLRAEAIYVYEIEKPAIVEVRKLHIEVA